MLPIYKIIQFIQRYRDAGRLILAISRVVQMTVELGFSVKRSLASCTLIGGQQQFFFSILAADYMKILRRVSHLPDCVCLVQSHVVLSCVK